MVGITDDDLQRLIEGPDAPGWTEFEAALVRAADELYADQSLSDSTYDALARVYDAQQLLDTVFTVGQYFLVSSVLNTFRVERDDGVTDAPMPARD
jgi:hypothetical protein